MTRHPSPSRPHSASPTGRRRRHAVVSALILCTLCSAPAVAAPPTSAVERARAISSSDGARTELPPNAEERTLPLSTRDQSVRRNLDLDLDIEPPRNLDLFRGCEGCNPEGCAPGVSTPTVSPKASVALQILAGLALLTILLLLARIFVRRGSARIDAEDENALITQARAQDPNAVENAAREASWNTAIHALWLETLLHVVRLGYRIPRAWTARELTARLPRPHDARPIFERLSQLAELAEFAHHTSTEEEFLEAQRASTILRDQLAPPTSAAPGRESAS